MASYKLSQLAQLDLEEITSYTVLTFCEEQARLYNAQMHNAAQTAADFPFFGLSYLTREGAVFQKYNSGRHALFYRPTEEGILVVRILHQMMDFDAHLD